MRGRQRLYVLFAVCTVASMACAEPIAVEDSGQMVRLNAPAERIVSLSAGSTEMLFALGVGDRIIGIDEGSDYPLAVRKIQRVGPFLRPSLEKIVTLKPDLIVWVSPSSPRGIAAEIRRRTKCPVFAIAAKSITGIVRGFEKMGALVGKVEHGRKLAEDMAHGVETVRLRVSGQERVRVFVEIAAPPSLMAAGPKSFINEAINLAGGANVARHARSPYPLISLEALASLDPDVYIIPAEDQRQLVILERVRARPGYRTLRSIRDGKVYTVDPDYLLRPGPRLGEGILRLARLLHPEVFLSTPVK